jgi:anti-sigma B factor antagonist
MPADFEVSIVDIGDVHVVSLRGELDIATSADLPERLVQIAGSTVVVDLTDLSFMDSSGLSALMVARKRIGVDGNSLVLSRPQPRVLQVLEAAGLVDWVSEWSPEWSQVPASRSGSEHSSELEPPKDGTRTSGPVDNAMGWCGRLFDRAFRYERWREDGNGRWR